MGEVYRATDTRLDRDVAIKVLPPEVVQDPARLGRFARRPSSSPPSTTRTSPPSAWGRRDWPWGRPTHSK
jgi:serine/threonine protein kinase